jgi:hypothetical protein
MAGLGAALLVLGGSASSAATAGRHGVSPWPYRTLQLGITSSPTQAQQQRRQAPIGFRYQYLAGGVNTGAATWQHWGQDFVASYIRSSQAVHEVPAFSYYELRQSQPGARQGQDSAADMINLRNHATMRAYYENLRAFFQQAATARGPVILQVEPDLWATSSWPPSTTVRPASPPRWPRAGCPA